MKKVLKWLFFGFIALIVISVIFAPDLTPEEQKAFEEKQKAEELAKVEEKIDEAVLAPYDKATYPKLLAKYGSRIDEVEQHRKIAATKAAMHDDCTEVWASELSEDSTIDNLRYFVDCKDAGRFEFTEQQLKDENAVAVANSETKYDEAKLTQECFDLIKAEIDSTAKLTLHEIAGTVTMVNKNSGRFQVKTDFEVTNAFGVETEYTGMCLFGKDIPSEFEIFER
ncbi:hypothetical protein VH441_07250 [Psychrobacter sp. HD31]|uniref:hypothetical protein n=1 Tax=Psychrobacter sp. HD31 TaxID=3112003 RepID=UPI003DA41CB2